MRIVAFLSVLLFSCSAVAGTLVVKGEEGIYSAGLASKWWADGAATHFQLSGEAEATAVAEQLRASLKGATIATEGDVVIIKGIPEPQLLEQLATVSLEMEEGEVDPLAALADAGMGAVAFKTPEGGGSIRATNPSFAIPAGVFGAPENDEKIEAQVLGVERKDFPQVLVKLRIRRPAADKELRKNLRRGAVFTAPVLMSGGDGAIDFEAEMTRQNLVAWYLETGDRVLLHVRKDQAGKAHIDWIARKR